MLKLSGDHKGFTLSEMMLAAAILLVAISALLATFINCLLLNESNNNLVIAANDAQYELEQIKGLAYAAINSYTESATNLEGENISVSVTEPQSGLKEVTVDVDWTERGKNKTFSLSTRIAR